MKERTKERISEEIRKLEAERRKHSDILLFDKFDAGMLKAYKLVLKWEG